MLVKGSLGYSAILWFISVSCLQCFVYVVERMFRVTNNIQDGKLMSLDYIGTTIHIPQRF